MDIVIKKEDKEYLVSIKPLTRTFPEYVIWYNELFYHVDNSKYEKYDDVGYVVQVKGVHDIIP